MAVRRKLNRHVTKLERMSLHKEKIEYHTKGDGLFRFRNRNNATLSLPKPAADVTKVVGPKGEWEGDSYFLTMVPREATLIATIRPQVQAQENTIVEQKLILDQPDQITEQGKVEHVSLQPVLPLNEQPGTPVSGADRLLNEDPMEGVTILRG